MKEDLFFDVALEHLLHLYVALTEIHTTSGLQTFQSDTEHADNLQLGLKYLGMILQDVIEDIDSEQVDDFWSEFSEHNKHLIHPDLMARKIKQRIAMRIFDEDSV